MKKILFLLVLPLILTACGSSKSLTRGEQYSSLYNEAPVSILVMPPINNSNNVDAKEYFYTSLAIPLMEKGYYVFSPYLALDLLQQESAYDSELFLGGDISAFGNVFGADAALFTVINKWQKHSSSIETEVEYYLISTRTNEVLYSHKGNLKLNTSVSSGNALVNLIGTVVNTIATPIVTAARQCNRYVLQDLPEGVYSLDYLKDKNVEAMPEILKGKVK